MECCYALRVALIKTGIIDGKILDSEKEKAIELSVALGIQENINWLGLRFPPFAKSPNYSALIMTSLSEGFPIVVIDALLYGIPIICSSHLSI